MELQESGFAVDAVAPQAAIYLTIRFGLVGKHTEDGKLLSNQEEVTSYILDKAGLAVVPFSSFGAGKTSDWYRLSVGTCKKEEIPEMLGAVRKALEALH
jgi:aspartate aminotransferase